LPGLGRYDFELVPAATGCALRPWAPLATPPIRRAAAATDRAGDQKGGEEKEEEEKEEEEEEEEEEEGRAPAFEAAAALVPAFAVPEGMLAGSVLVRLEDREPWSSQVTHGWHTAGPTPAMLCRRATAAH